MGFAYATTALLSNNLVPLKSGHIRQMVIGPREAYWPNASSRKKTGRPARASIRA